MQINGYSQRRGAGFRLPPPALVPATAGVEMSLDAARRSARATKNG
jgi:hypothetical protein